MPAAVSPKGPVDAGNAGSASVPLGAEAARLYDAFITYSHAKDKPIASALQSAIQRLGKAWYQRRALRLFRDDTSLTASPHLWPDIEKALGNARFLILLASPEAAASPWVDKELTWWLDHNDAQTVLIALTAGDLDWQPAARDFRWSPATPLPSALRGRYTDEPRWIDLRSYRGETSARGARFIELAADFAAAIHGTPKDDLLSQEVRQQRRTLRLASSAVTALVVLLSVAGWEWRSAVLAEHRAIEQQQVADKNSKLARQQTEIANHQTLLANQETLKAEQRAAVLTAKASQSLTDEGALDEALLSTLDASKVFNDENAPDEIRISLTKALDLKSTIETYQLFPNMTIFETDDALVFVDPVTKDIWRMTDSPEPRKVFRGSTSDSEIIVLQQGARDDEYILVRSNRDVERINTQTGSRVIIGSLTNHSLAVEKYDPLRANDGFVITPDGLVTRYHDPDIVLDSSTGRVFHLDEIKGVSAVLGKSPGGGLYAIDRDKTLLEIKESQDKLIVTKPKLTYYDKIRIRFGSCIAGMPIPAKERALREVDPPYDSVSDFACHKIDHGYLLTAYPYSATQVFRFDFLISSNGEKIDIRSTLESALSGGLAHIDFAWVGGYKTSQNLPGAAGVKLLGILSNRTAYVLGHHSSNISGYWPLLLDHRYPDFVTNARFLGPNQLVTVQAATGRLVVHDFDKEQKALALTAMEQIIGSKTPVGTLLHKGTCVGGWPSSIPLATTVIAPDGDKVEFDLSEKVRFDLADENENPTSKYSVRISGRNDFSIGYDPDMRCIQISNDWKRLLIVKSDSVHIYDFEKVRRTGNLAGNEIGTLHTGAWSAFFLGSTDDKIITADGSNVVRLWNQGSREEAWQSSVFYKGDNTITYAEPDSMGEHLIVKEDVGDHFLHGFLYSLSARQVWFDLDQDYKWLAAAFTDDGSVVVSKHGTWTGVYPVLPLSKLTALADKALSPECRPPSPENYKRSRCWPASYR